MSSYFDDAVHEIDQASRLYGLRARDEEFLRAAARVEERMIRDVTRLTGDREFPADLRDKAVGLIATLRAGPPEGIAPTDWPPTQGVRRTTVLRRSALVDALHRCWHELASRGIETRFGRLTDDPLGDLVARDRHDAPNF